MSIHPARCDCGKLWFATRAQAKQARAAIARSKNDHGKVRFYKCQYGQHHWTSSLHHTTRRTH